MNKYNFVDIIFMNKDKKTFYFGVFFAYIIVIFFYYFSLLLSNELIYSNGILKFINVIAELFPAIENRANIGEKLYKNGLYIKYILCVNIIFILLSFIPVLFWLYKNFYHKSININLTELDYKTRVYFFIYIFIPFILYAFYFSNEQNIKNISNLTKIMYTWLGITIISYSFYITIFIFISIIFIELFSNKKYEKSKYVIDEE